MVRRLEEQRLEKRHGEATLPIAPAGPARTAASVEVPQLWRTNPPLAEEIADHRQTEEALRVQEAVFRSMADTVPAMIWVAGTDRRCIYFNRAWLVFTGRAMEQETGDGWVEGVHPDDVRACLATYISSFDARRPFMMEYRLRRFDGEYCWIYDSGAPWFTPQGDFAGYIGSCMDISKRKRYEQEIAGQKKKLQAANARLKQLAMTDGLTRLKNHQAFQERTGKEFRRALRYRTPLSLLLLDVDHFKQYNDSFGHPAGDKVLKTVAQLLRHRLRDSDFVARYGGEEFGIILPNTDREGAIAIAERFRSGIAEAPWKERVVTASFGAATARADMSTYTTLIAEADRALYQSKAAGRNRTTHATDMPDLKD